MGSGQLRIHTFFETPIVNASLRLNTSDVATRVSGLKQVQSTEVYILKGSFCNLHALAPGWRCIYSLHSADVSQQGLNSCPLLWSCFTRSYHVGVSKRLLRSITLAVYYLSFNKGRFISVLARNIFLYWPLISGADAGCFPRRGASLTGEGVHSLHPPP